MIGGLLGGLGGLAGSGLSAIGSIGAAGIGMLPAVGNYLLGKENLGYAKDAQGWMQSAQQHTWNREDDAVRRRVTDLKAAGLSPVLAAGSAAQTGAPVQIGQVRNEANIGTAAEKAISGIAQMTGIRQSVENIRLTQAQQELVNQQASKTEADKLIALQKVEPEVKSINEGIKRIIEDTKGISTENLIKAFEYAEMSSDQTTKGRMGMHRFSQANAAGGLAKTGFDVLKQLYDDAVNGGKPQTTKTTKEDNTGYKSTTTTVKGGRRK